MTLVVDASVTLAWIFTEERTLPVQKILDRLIDEQAFVPAIWRLEIANGLQMSVRRGRIDAATRDTALRGLALLNITTDPDTDNFAWSTTLSLAEQHRLTLYDAAYLELALRLRLPLASLDKELRAAGDAAGVTLLGM
ncbi:MAG: type II toxin-antitoxin system VapC family toxin [Pseudomonadota bacterium]